jgi:methionyl-tRNA formyltransferase
MKIVFFGSDDFAAAHLLTMFELKHDIVACVTPPDQAKGRGMALTTSPVAALARARDCPVLQPTSLREVSIVESLTVWHADLFVVIAYGRLLPRSVLDVPRLGAVNVHGSLLPRYRGAAPINWAILNGDKQTGISVIHMNERMDAGDVLGQSVVDIGEEDTAVELRRSMMIAGQKLLSEVLDQIRRGAVVHTPQDDARATLAPKLTKGMGLIDWQVGAEAISCQIRGLQPWPGAFTYCHGKSVKVLSARMVLSEGFGTPGEILEIQKDGMLIATGKGTLLVSRVHPADSKPMDAVDFVNGQRIRPGFVFESL